MTSLGIDFFSVTLSGLYEGFPVKFVAYGSFEDVKPGLTFSEILSKNSDSLISSRDLYTNNNLLKTVTYKTPVDLMGSLDGSPTGLSKLYAGDDVIYAHKLLDRSDGGIDFFGYGGNDRFYAYGSHEYDDIFYGGDGIDSLIYSGPKGNYNIQESQWVWNPATQQSGNDGYIVTDNTGRDGTVQASGIERMVFSDTAFAIDDVAGQAYRIYKAAFDRAPDLEGLGYWINDMDNGASLTTVASGFINSNEFRQTYGTNTSDADFIKLLYENVLDRQPDADGYAYWINDMQNGLSRQSLLASFSESTENKNNVEQLISNGIEYTPFIS